MYFTDPWGFEPWSTGKYKWTWDEWFQHPSTTDQDRICGEKIVPEDPIFWLLTLRNKAKDAASKAIRGIKSGAEKVKDCWYQKPKPYQPYAPPSPMGGEKIPATTRPHTRLGTNQGRKGSYPAAREFGSEGEWIRDIHFTEHGRPDVPGHVNPHQHQAVPNPTGGTPQYGPSTPYNW
jgi:hypothetical protein